jgi:hypothetical protein
MLLEQGVWGIIANDSVACEVSERVTYFRSNLTSTSI